MANKRTWTLEALLASSGKLRSWRAKATNYANSTKRILERTIPYAGTGALLFQFDHWGMTEENKIHRTHLLFYGLQIHEGDAAKRFTDNPNFFPVTFNEKEYMVEKPSIRAPVKVRCTCSDSYYRFTWWNSEANAAFGGKPRAYHRKTAPPPEGRPYVNPGHHPGLCIAEGALVSTLWGLIPIEKIRVGDQVLTTDGPRKVTHAGKTGTRPTLRIHFESGRILPCTAEHPILTVRANGELGYVEAKELLTTDRGIGSLMQAPTIVGNAEEALWGRLLGYMIAEGSAGYKSRRTGEARECVFSNTDPKLLDDFSNTLRKLGVSQFSRRRHAVRMNSATTREFEKRGMVWGAKSHIIPPFVLEGSRDVVANFLLGYWGGDGHWDGKRQLATAATISPLLAHQLQGLLGRFGIYTSCARYRSGAANSWVWFVRCGARDYTNLLQFVRPIKGPKCIGPVRKGGVPKRDRLRHIPLNELISDFIEKAFDEEEVLPCEAVVQLNGLEINGLPHDQTALLKDLRTRGMLQKQNFRGGAGKDANVARLSNIWSITRDYRLRAFKKARIGGRGTHIFETYTFNKHKESVRKFLVKVSNLPEMSTYLGFLARDDLFHDRVIKVTQGATVPVYDLTVEGAQHFFVNGIGVHNCKHIVNSTLTLESAGALRRLGLSIRTAGSGNPAAQKPVFKPAPHPRSEPLARQISRHKAALARLEPKVQQHRTELVRLQRAFAKRKRALESGRRTQQPTKHERLMAQRPKTPALVRRLGAGVAATALGSVGLGGLAKLAMGPALQRSLSRKGKNPTTRKGKRRLRK